MTAPNPPRRVVITSPRMRAPRRQPQRVATEIDAQTRLGQVYMSSLIRAQRRLALLVLGVLAILLLGLPLLFSAVPSVADVTVLWLPLPWLLLGAAVYPVLLCLGWFYVRRAERNERDFAEVVRAEDRREDAERTA